MLMGYTGVLGYIQKALGNWVVTEGTEALGNLDGDIRALGCF